MSIKSQEAEYEDGLEEERLRAAAIDRRLAAPANCVACKWNGHVGEVKSNWTCPKCGSPVWLAEWDHPTHPTKQ